MHSAGVAVEDCGRIDRDTIRQRVDVPGEAHIVLREAVAAELLPMPPAALGAEVRVAAQAVDTLTAADEMLRLDPDTLPDREVGDPGSDCRDLPGQLVSILA